MQPKASYQNHISKYYIKSYINSYASLSGRSFSTDFGIKSFTLDISLKRINYILAPDWKVSENLCFQICIFSIAIHDTNAESII